MRQATALPVRVPHPPLIADRGTDRLLNRFTSVRRFCHEGHVRLRGEQPGDALSHDRMIVDAENSDALGIVAHDSLVSLGPKTF